jgi:phosphatidate phosphatase
MNNKKTKPSLILYWSGEMKKNLFKIYNFFVKNNEPTFIQQLIQSSLDSLFLLVLIVAGALYEYYFQLEPYKRGFFRNDQRILYPHQEKQTVSGLLDFGYSATPILLIIFFEIITSIRYFKKKSLRELFFSLFNKILNFIYAMGLMFLIVVAIKYFCGRLRPDFISRCDPDYSNINPDVNYYIVEDICRGDKSVIKEGRVSFPSNHTAFAMYSAFYVFFYLETMNIQISNFWKGIIQLTYMIFSIFISISRNIDNWHHCKYLFNLGYF